MMNDERTSDTQLHCRPRHMSYNWESKKGFLIIENGNCTDQGGCIAFFMAIDDQVQEIVSFYVENLNDQSVYKKMPDGKWHGAYGKGVQMTRHENADRIGREVLDRQAALCNQRLSEFKRATEGKHPDEVAFELKNYEDDIKRYGDETQALLVARLGR